MNDVLGLFGKVVPIVQPSSRSHEVVMNKLRKTHDECGGKRVNEKEIEGLSKFEGLKYLLVRKLDIIRKEIGSFDRVECRRKLHKVRKMILDVKNDFKKLEKEVKATENPRLHFLKKKVDPTNDTKRYNVDLIGRHIQEVEMLFKKRYSTRTSEERIFIKRLNVREKKILGIDEESDNSNNEEFDMEEIPLWMDNVALPSDPESSNLPSIDISQTMIRVKNKRNQLQEGLEHLDTKLDTLKDQVETMNEEIIAGGETIIEIERKVEKENKEIKKVTKKVEKATSGVCTQTKLLLIVMLMMCIAFAFVMIYIVLFAAGLVPGSFRYH